MLIVYIEQPSPRLTFILKQLLFRISGTEFLTTIHRKEYLESPFPGISYSKTYAGRGLWILPSGFLEEEQWRPFTPNQSKLEGIFTLFPSSISSEKAFPFDLFSAAFYLLTRYEEYNSEHVDVHGRFLSSYSVLYQNQALQIPVIEKWTGLFQKKLMEIYPDLHFHPRSYRVFITHDIDHPYLYRNKGFLFSLYGIIRDWAKGKPKEIRTRLMTVFHLQEDPYFNLIYLQETGVKNGFEPLFFIHSGPFRKYDRRFLYPSPRYKKTLKSISKVYNIGLHPSYHSNSNAAIIGKERKKLEKWIGQKVTMSRQHYLRFVFPKTPQALLKAGITQDYSLGYSEECGFRAGTSIPFPFFDLDRNQETNLMLHPLVAMDVTLRRAGSLSEIENKIVFLYEQCKLVGGDFTLLIHNSSFEHREGWEGWKEMYESLLKKLK